MSGVGEEVDEGYLETNANLVSVVSILSLPPIITPAILASIMCPKVLYMDDCCLEKCFLRLRGNTVCTRN